MGMLTIERLGGLAGFGGAHLKSEGRVALADLPPADQEAVNRLLAMRGKSPAAPGGDMFTYRITLESDGRSRTVEVSEELVPDALKACVTDTLR